MPQVFESALVGDGGRDIVARIAEDELALSDAGSEQFLSDPCQLDPTS